MTDVAAETIMCRGCGKTFSAVVLLELDPVRHRDFAENDELMRRVSTIECPNCRWFEVRPIRMRRGA